ncbi:MAG: hypothetical protein ABIH49_03575 [archaeon]
MEYCYKCGMPETRTLLFDAIFPDCIDKICTKCSKREDFPIIKKKQIYPENKPNVHERLKKISGFESRTKKVNEEVRKQDVTLKEIIDRNYRRHTEEDADLKDKLISNFHWIIMRVRRGKHISQEQLAKAISEPEIAIKMVEQGIIPKRNFGIIDKIENYLGIRLKKNYSLPEKKDFSVFDRDKMKNLSVEDLRKMREEKETGILENSDSSEVRREVSDDFDEYRQE